MTRKEVLAAWRALTSRPAPTAMRLAEVRPIKLESKRGGSGDCMSVYLPECSVNAERAATYLHLLTERAGFSSVEVFVGTGSGRRRGYADAGTALHRQDMENELRD